jgi:hypothetical protein
LPYYHKLLFNKLYQHCPQQSWHHQQSFVGQWTVLLSSTEVLLWPFVNSKSLMLFRSSRYCSHPLPLSHTHLLSPSETTLLRTYSYWVNLLPHLISIFHWNEYDRVLTCTNSSSIFLCLPSPLKKKNLNALNGLLICCLYIFRAGWLKL